MVTKLATFVILLFADARAQTSHVDPLKFLGREVTITEAELDADDFFPKGPASICVEGPQRQCYTAPRDFGRGPGVAAVQLQKGVSALLFSVSSGGVSGFEIHFALLRPGTTKDLEDIFPEISISNQSQHAFWNDSAISQAPIFLTAEYVFGPNEGHYGEHRYIVSAYVLKPSWLIDGLRYYLEDQYVTVHKYDLDANADVLTSEKPEILARLRRLNTDAKPQAPK